MKLPLEDHPLQKVYEKINKNGRSLEEMKAAWLKAVRRSLGQKIRWMKK